MKSVGCIIEKAVELPVPLSVVNEWLWLPLDEVAISEGDVDHPPAAVRQ